MTHTLHTKGVVYNVKFNIRLLNGLFVQQKYRSMTEQELERKTVNDVWNDGKTSSVTVYIDGQFYCNWKLSRGERPMAV